MKKLLAGLVVAASMAGLNAVACGGMTQIDPPTIEMPPGEGEPPTTSIMTEMKQTLVIC